jgi:acyl-coenzyme A synthetase/AMP-(fatty) acid ligase
MIVTSGTTGQPKFIKVTIQEFGVRIGGFTGGNWRSLLCLPGLSSGWTFNALGAALTAGQTLCFAVSPFQAARMIELYAIDYVVASTEQLLALTFVARKSGAQLRTLRMVEVSGSVPTAVLLQAAMAYVCKDIYCRYGTSELGPMARAAARDVLSRPGLAGQLMPGAEIMIADGSGSPCPPGVVGHIKGRLDQRWNTARDDKRAWIDVGDLGWMTADGELYVLGRPSDTTSDLAQNATAGISPVHEVEHLLRLEWDAADAAAVLVEGGTANEKLAIWIAAVDCKDADAAKLEALLRTRGMDFSVRLFALKSIPRGVNGKVQRTQLKSAMQAVAGQAGRA